MKITYESNALSRALELVMMVGQATISKKDKTEELAPTSGVRITADPNARTLLLEAQNDMTYVSYKLFDVKIAEGGTFLTQGKRLLALLKLFVDCELQIITLENKVRIFEMDGGDYQLQLLNVPGPLMPPKLPPAYSVHANALTSILKKCGKMVEKKDLISPLSAIKIDWQADGTATCHASNKFNLCRFKALDTGVYIKAGLLILPSVLNIIANFADGEDVNFVAGTKGVQAFNDRFYINTATITGNYPDVARVFEKVANIPNKCKLSRKRFVEAVTRAAVVGADSTDGQDFARVTVQTMGNGIMVEAVSEIGTAKEFVHVDEATGEIPRIAFNATTLLNGLCGFEAEQVTMRVKEPHLPIKLEEDSEQLVYAISPMRL